jgi:energy-coupling factor transporter ATP-binding protein EcfA2
MDSNSSFRDVNLVTFKDELVAIIGPTGTGKSRTRHGFLNSLCFELFQAVVKKTVKSRAGTNLLDRRTQIPVERSCCLIAAP